MNMSLSDTTEFYGDVWVTSDGSKWLQVRATDSDATYPARSNHVAGMIDDVLVVTGGYNADGALDDTWAWDRSPDSVTNDYFVLDFTNETEFTDYVDELSPVSVIPMVSPINEAKLNSLGVYSVDDLANIDSWKVKLLQDFSGLDYPDICLHIKWAEAIVDNCVAVIELPDNVGWNGTFQREGNWDARLKVNQTKSQAQITAETDFCESIFLEWTGSWTNYLLFQQKQPYPFPLKCKSKVGTMALPSGVVYQDRLWVTGGLIQKSPTGMGSKTSNVWYREPHIPSTGFAVKPESQTGDQIVEFTCSDTYSSWCRCVGGRCAKKGSPTFSFVAAMGCAATCTTASPRNRRHRLRGGRAQSALCMLVLANLRLRSSPSCSRRALLPSSSRCGSPLRPVVLPVALPLRPTVAPGVCVPFDRPSSLALAPACPSLRTCTWCCRCPGTNTAFWT
jgi:hypothetical protein